MKRWIRVVTTYPLAVFLTLTLLTIVFLPGATTVMGNAANVFDLRKEIPKTHPLIQACDRFDQVFGEDTNEAIAIESKQGITPELLVAISQISEELENWPGGITPRRVISLATARDCSVGEGGEIKSEYLLDRFKKTGEIDGIEERIRNNPLLFNRLVSRDFSTHKIVVSFDPEADQATVYHRMRRLVGEQLPSGCDAYFCGRMNLNETIHIAAEKQVRIYFPVALVVMAIVLIVFLGGMETVGTLTVVSLGLIWTFGIMAYTDTRLTVLTSSLPILLLAVANAYGIHLCYWVKKELSQQAEHDSGRAVAETLRKVGQKIFFAATSSALGFFSLYLTFRLEGVRSFGLWSAVGIILCSLFTLAWLASLLTMYFSRRSARERLARKPAQTASEKPFRWLADRVLVEAVRNPKVRNLLWSIAALTTIICILGVTRLKAGSAPHRFFPPKSETGTTIEKFMDKFGGNASFFIKVDADRENGAKDPDFLTRVDELQRLILHEKNVGDVISLVDILKRINQIVVGGGKPEFFRLNDLDAAEKVAETILFYDLSGRPDDLYDWTTPDFRYLRLNVWADVGDSVDVARLGHKIYDYAETLGLKIDLGGDYPRWGEPLNHYVVKGKILNLLLCFPLVFVFSSIALRGWRPGLVAILPLTFTTVMIFGLMGYLGIRLDMATCTIASVVVFLVVDWSFYFIGKVKERVFSHGEDVRTGVCQAIGLETSPILIDAVTNASAYLVLTLSSFEPIRIFGWLVALAQIVGSLATLILISIVLYWRPELLSAGKARPRPTREALHMAVPAADTSPTSLLQAGRKPK